MLCSGADMTLPPRGGVAVVFLSSSLLLLLSASSGFHAPVSAFSPATAMAKTRTTTTTTTGSALFTGGSEIDRIKSAGCGLPLEGPGNAVGGSSGWDVDPALDDRIQLGPSYQQYVAAAATATGTVQQEGQELSPAQHWLEDIGVPGPVAKPTKPAQATVLGRLPLIVPGTAPGDIQHVLMRLPDGFRYVEGQSLSVIPPGTDSRTGKRHKPRLYSIASTRYGDVVDGSTVSLCVRRAVYVDPETNREDPSKKGVCSNFLCDVRPGDVVNVAGPIGKTMLLPEESDRDIIMVATGTGIAPFRGFLHRLFMENTVARHMYTGNAWLIFGVPTTGGILYGEELDAMVGNAAAASGGLDNLEITYAVSREMTNRSGGKLYVQDVLEQRADELFDKLENGAVIYFCGLKGMMPGILQSLERVASQKGLDWSQQLKKYQANHQWHVEVY